jgi:hypothetical protein
MLKIEKGIPIPTTTARKGNNVEQLKAMEPGDSVYFDAPIKKKATRFYRVAKRLGVKVIIRVEGEGMRMWRVKEEESADTKTLRKVEEVRETIAKVRKGMRKRALGTGKSNKPISAKPAPAIPGNEKGDVTFAAMEDAKRKAKASRDKRYREQKKLAKMAPTDASAASMGVSDV